MRLHGAVKTWEGSEHSTERRDRSPKSLASSDAFVNAETGEVDSSVIFADIVGSDRCR